MVAACAMFDFMSACTVGAPAAPAVTTSPTPGSGSSSGETCSAASCAWYEVSATTIA